MQRAAASSAPVLLAAISFTRQPEIPAARRRQYFDVIYSSIAFITRSRPFGQH